MKSLDTISLAAAALLYVGCSPVQFGPTIEGVSPNWGYNGEPTSITVMGDAFLPGMAVNGESVSRYDRDFIITLNGPSTETLEGVKQVGAGQLDGVVPPGLTPGWYGLRVDTPGGETAHLEDAFEVTSSRADAISISLSRTVVPISGLAIVRMALLDPDGGAVQESVQVQVRMVPTHTDGSGFSISAGDLEEPSIEPGSGTIVGHLGATGEGFVGISSSETDEAWLEVSAIIRDRFTLTARELVRFEAGQVAGVKVGLPDIGTHVRAGTSFPVALELVDFAGNTVHDQPATVALTEHCLGGSLNETITFVGNASVSVTPTRSCLENRIKAFGVVEGAGVEGVSEPFEVRPGVLSELLVMSSPERIQAGIEDVIVFAQGADAWQNPSTALLGGLILSDEAGPLSDANGNGHYECDEVVPGTAQCTARLYIASESRVIHVINPDEVSGQTGPIQVIAGAGAGIEVTLGDTTVTAGDSVEVNLQIQDSFGNALILGSDDRDALLFFDDDGPISCLSNGGVVEDRTYEFECEFFIAGPDRQLNVLSPTMGVGGSTEPLLVLPGALSHVESTLDEWVLSEGAVAGDGVAIALEGFDQYGNRVQGLHDLSVRTVGGAAIPDSTVLSEGVGLVNVFVQTALKGESVWFFQDGQPVGGTECFDVSAGPPSSVDLALDPPWAWVGEPLAVTITVMDEYGNTAQGDSGPFSLRSRGGLGPDIVGTMTGEIQVDMAFTTAGIGDVLEVDAWGFTTTYGLVDVARACGPLGGPGLRATGHADGRICLPVDGDTDLALSWDIPDFLHGYVRLDRSTIYRGTATEVDVTVGVSGGWTADALLIDGDGCGVAESIDVYVGHEGEAVGPVSVISASDALIGGADPATGSTGVWISADQCSGDPAAGASLFIRTNKGVVEGLGETPVLPSGKGLTFNLNDEGQAEVEWSMSDEETAAEAQLLVGSGDGSAKGVAEIVVHGDSRPPYVLGATPSGSYGGLFSEVEIEFSEPMLPASGIADHLMISSGAMAYFPEVVFDPSMTVLTATLDSPVDSSSTAWEVVLRDSLRDTAGNRLDGDLNSLPGGDWVGQIGPLGPDPIDVVSCSLTTGWFQPDGDHGPGLASEFVWISVESTDVGDWWQVDVTHPDGLSVSRTFSPMIRPFDETLMFDGKDLNGRILKPGRYEVAIYAVDGIGNTGQPCVSSVVVKQSLNAD